MHCSRNLQIITDTRRRSIQQKATRDPETRSRLVLRNYLPRERVSHAGEVVHLIGRLVTIQSLKRHRT